MEQNADRCAHLPVESVNQFSFLQLPKCTNIEKIPEKNEEKPLMFCIDRLVLKQNEDP